MPVSNTDAIDAAAAAAGVPPPLAIAVAEQESGYTPPRQFNPDGSLIVGSHGEIGMFQLMPGTAADLGVDPSDPQQNIQGGVTFLAQMIAQFGVPGGLYAYNWGPGNVQSWLEGQQQLPSSVAAYGAAILSRAGPGAATSPAAAESKIPAALWLLGGLVLLALVT